MKTLNRKQIIYLVVAICTAALILAVCIWAALGGSATTMKIIDGELVFNESVRSEYLLGEDVQTDGVELRVGKHIYSGDELTFTVDNATAGDKMVEVSHTEDGNYYRAYFPVKYFAVRHFDVRRQPTGLTYDEEGNISGLIGFELWAELSGEPRELPRPLEVHNYSTVIEVTEEFCDLTVIEDEKYGGYIANITCGGQKIEYYFIELNGTMHTLNGTARILDFINESESGAKLTLFVTQTNGANGADGWYLYEREDGTTEQFRFAYHLEGWASFFESNKYDERIFEQQDGDDYLVMIEETVFRATKSDWHRAILAE